MRQHNPTVVWIPFNPLTVAHLDQLAERLSTEIATVPHEIPLRKAEQLGEALALAWKGNEFRGGFPPILIDKAA